VAGIAPRVIETFFSGMSVIFAAVAAILWGWSALVNLPVIGSAYAAIHNLDPFYAALKRVARLNAFAALSAFLSASAQATALYLSLPK
jgi:hypothetical protein